MESRENLVRSHIFVEHIRKHLFEMGEAPYTVMCKICNKSMDEIIKEETNKGVWTAEGIYIPGENYIDRNGKMFKIVEVHKKGEKK